MANELAYELVQEMAEALAKLDRSLFSIIEHLDELGYTTTSSGGGPLAKILEGISELRSKCEAHKSHIESATASLLVSKERLDSAIIMNTTFDGDGIGT